VVKDAATLCWTALWGVGLGFLSPVFSWSFGLSGISVISVVVSLGGWFVGSHCFLLHMGQVAIELCGHSLTIFAKVCFCLHQAAAELL
jgi:hypothetical protein